MSPSNDQMGAAGMPAGLLRSSLMIPLLIATAQLAVQVIFHSNYGYFRDELYYIACSDHLAFGYVDQPPLSIAILKVSRFLSGDSLQAIRLLPSLAGAGVVVLASLMARSLGGGRFAQGFAALGVAAAHSLMGTGRYYSMNAFDVLFWAAAGYVVFRILADESPKLWILFGALVGLGLLNKYSIGFLCIGLFAGLLLTSRRRHLASGWFWLGAGVAAFIFLPHIFWEIAHDFPSLEFMRNASQEKNVSLSVLDFVSGQIRDINLFNLPVWLSGIYFFYAYREGRFRALAWMYAAVFLVMVLAKAKVYYLAPIYPILLAGGAVFLESFFEKRGWKRIKLVYPFLLVASAIAFLPFALPVLPVDQFVRYQHALGLTPHAEERSSVGELPQHYADEFGWEEMTATVAGVFKKLTPEEQSACVIYVRNYGEAGAIDFFGGKYGLPNALCGHNNYWLWGPGERTGDIAIIVGGSRDLQENFADLNRVYEHVELAGTTNARYAMPYEIGKQIFICKGMKTTFQKIWPGERFYI
jgi:4-amino-4-deoxy-L-arabinose transferase-like glycosyltransferase